MPNEEQLPQEMPKGTVHATGTTVEFRHANRDIAKIIRLDDLESTTDYLLFAMFYQLAALAQRQDLTAAASIKSAQFLEQLLTRSSQAPGSIDEVMNSVMKKIKDFQALAAAAPPRVITTPVETPE